MAPLFKKSLYQIPPDWQEVAIEVRERPGISLLLGATDTGKTTFARFLIHELLRAGRKVAFVDSDLGQSYLGPPATISLGLFSSPEDEVRPWTMRFVGSVTPMGHLLQTVVDTKKLVDRAAALGHETVVIDTSGFVSGGAAFQLKLKKIDLIDPVHLIAIQREGEVEHILMAFEGREGLSIHRITPSERVKVRTREERVSYRERAFRRYFDRCPSITLDLRGLFTYGNRDLPFMDPLNLSSLPLKGTLVGLNDGNNETLALGMIEGMRGEEMVVKTPLKDLDRLRILHIGGVKISGL